MKDIILESNDLHAAYGQSMILWGLNFKAEKGKVTTIMGRNGVGKTTLLKTIMSLVQVSKGTITYKGEEIQTLPSFKKANMGIGYVPQGREIIPKLTVYENIKLGMEALGSKSKAKIPEDEIYAMFPILKDFRKRLGGNLSGGQQQQLAIARVLVSNPSLILLDEPTEGIQPSIAQEIGQVLKNLAAEKGITILLVEQKIDFAKQITDYYYFMDRGRMLMEGSKDELDLDDIRKYLSV
ncbi:urea ABC transporter ATP-binding subunit UrtE [Cytophaga hutchinsonii]|jgi:urea transport system ATP-binding protein|uniref:Urea ABC transporter ATP-binding protein n=1 Tax=Cytophaga hutchinsonii (strain ATCC 33406 / DSM 1761 / CIP 103989 / NBRC 15051 / NCIMB 9469 / D465) TaxID=269798 RepID=A0A6N4SQI8_CYTH3|nr:urea ABC transporter ATP-binding subunit UrtE [Cytophaga hutchinsonii]ABG58531.1 urea ABC transporter ATP-binding protein [Cytophaga hutchinsonii ATCC 33406]SFX76366.1 urea ABC transporter ATP-binding protein [Cytophaga hutchinsonii ATCC 33406]